MWFASKAKQMQTTAIHFWNMAYSIMRDTWSIILLKRYVLRFLCVLVILYWPGKCKNISNVARLKLLFEYIGAVCALTNLGAMDTDTTLINSYNIIYYFKIECRKFILSIFNQCNLGLCISYKRYVPYASYWVLLKLIEGAL